MEWQPIETAPEEGPYLVFGGNIETELDFDGPDEEVSGVVKVTGRWGGSYGVSDTCYYSVWVRKPTHWMPLPSPPQGGE